MRFTQVSDYFIHDNVEYRPSKRVALFNSSMYLYFLVNSLLVFIIVPEGLLMPWISFIKFVFFSFSHYLCYIRQSSLTKSFFHVDKKPELLNANDFSVFCQTIKIALIMDLFRRKSCNSSRICIPLHTASRIAFLNASSMPVRSLIPP